MRKNILLNRKYPEAIYNAFGVNMITVVSLMEDDSWYWVSSANKYLIVWKHK